MYKAHTLSMTTTNLDKMLKQFNREWIGVEHQVNRYFQDSPLNPSNYPPYNIEQFDENSYCITIAIAGFHKDNIEITVENSLLTVDGKSLELTGDKRESNDENFLYRGIANRDFKLRFTLSDYVKVESATFANGLLCLNLEREIPEAMKPKTITIK